MTESKTESISVVELFAALEVSFSQERLRSYKASCNNDPQKTIELYLWNSIISQALYRPLQVLEVSTRNAMNRQLCDKYGSSWYRNQNPVLFSDPQAEKITKVIGRFDKQRPIVVGDVVADLSFGFWSDLVDHQTYDELWKVALHKAFPNRPKGTKRSTAAVPFRRLNTLRNRIAHHEPIWTRNLKYDYELTIQLISWICPTTSAWAAQSNDFQACLSLKPK